MASAAATQKYALLVGIDLYSTNYNPGNLSGCVNDITMIYDFLHSKMNIPKSQITVLQAPNNHGANVDYNATDAPTKKNLLKKFSILENTPAGSFIYFHYSGHGDRRKTQYPKQKVDHEGVQAKDELVCTWENDLTDVELGEALDKLAEHHTVCAVLDCCHSGGADRQSVSTGKDEMIRCRSLYARETLENEMHSLEINEDNESALELKKESGSMRSGNLQPSYLYRDRKYNLFAAAQAREYAIERAFRDLDGKKVRHGILTYYLVKALEKQLKTLHPMTYGQLQSLLTVQMAASKLLISTQRQQPMHLGDQNRHVFATSRESPQPCYLLANVTAVSKDTITINRGWASNVAVNDELTLYAPTDVVLGIQRGASLGSLQCKVSHVRDLDSEAICSGRYAVQLTPGYFAVLIKRTNPVVIDIQLPAHIPALDIMQVQAECLASIQPSLPMDLSFGNSRPNADYVVTVKQDLQLRTPTAVPQAPNNTTTTSATTPYNASELLQLIQHLGFYHLATIPSFQHTGILTHEYRYSFEPEALGPKASTNAIANYRFSFKNIHKKALYIALFNLTADYSVSSLFPGPEQPWFEVDSGKSIGFTVEIVVPTSLKQAAKNNAGFVLRDVFKLFVTPLGVDFRHYLLPGLDVNPAIVEIKAKAGGSRVLSSSRCTVEEKEILITVP